MPSGKSNDRKAKKLPSASFPSAVNYFQNELRTRILKDVDLTYQLLEKRTDQEIESFFYFFFNEIHPQYETIPKELEKLKNKDMEFYEQMEIGHKKAIEDSGH